jgi:hypothetical protein
MKPTIELPSRFKSQEDFFSEVGELLAARNFFNFDGRIVHLVEVPGQETQFVEVTPEYLADYLNREFQTVEQTTTQKTAF